MIIQKRWERISLIYVSIVITVMIKFAKTSFQSGNIASQVLLELIVKLLELRVDLQVTLNYKLYILTLRCKEHKKNLSRSEGNF